MALRKKTLIIVIVTLAVLMLIIYLITRNTMLDSYSRLEGELVEKNVETAVNAINNDVLMLSATTADWSGWDDTYEFIQNENSNYLKDNLVDTSFTVNRLNLMLFINSSGRFVSGKGFDLTGNKQAPVPEAILREHLSKNSPLLDHENEESSVTGIILIPDGPMLISSRPITTSDHKGPIRGTLIMGRYLNSREQENISRMLQLNISTEPVGRYLSPDFNEALNEITPGKPLFVKPLNNDTVAGYTLLKDIYGKPALILKIEMSREVFRQGQVSSLYLLTSLLAAGIVFAVVIVFLLERTILSRLAELSLSVDRIGSSSDFSGRVKVEGNDELSNLGTMLNRMLAALEMSRDRLMVSEEQYRGLFEALNKTKAKYEELFDALPVCVFEVDQNGWYTLANRACYQQFGYREEDIGDGLNVVDVVAPSDRDRAIENVKTVLKGIHLDAGEYTALRRDGTTYPAVVHTRPIIREGSIVGLRGVLLDITNMKKTQEALRESEEKYRSILENIEDTYFETDLNGNITFFNDKGCEMTGYSREELTGAHYSTYALPEDVPILFEEYNRIFRTGMPGKLLDWAIKRKDGSKVYFEASVSPIRNNEGKITGFRGIARDITERREVEEKLRESEEKYRLVFENSPLGILHFDGDGYITACNDIIVKIADVAQERIIGTNLLSIKDVKLVNSVNKALLGEQSHFEGDFHSDSGQVCPVKVDFAPIIIRENKVIGGVCIVEDITERRLAEEQLKYMSFHDSLTGLYNRAYFEQEMARLESGRHYPAGIIVCDVDGLKLVNDTLGHDKGDDILVAAAGVIRDSFRGSDVIARIGGDEFAVLLPNSSRIVVEDSYKRIKNAVETHNRWNKDLPLSMSVGFAISGDSAVKLSDVFKEADNCMYREKLHSSQSARSSIVQTLMKALEARDFITEGHADRLQDLVASLGNVLRLPDRKISDLRLLAQFHDIGKVGIPDRILFKSGPLTPNEWMEMQRHCEIGHRIALSAPDLVPVADWILKHHECWDGNGYPLGLKGEDIPLECRILALADAYDAMTSDRPYRSAMSHVDAMSELRKCAGTQFDPNLFLKFEEVMEKNNQEKHK
ncbi:MAG: PAS domain S-box protein [Bacillota bacterium]